MPEVLMDVSDLGATVALKFIVFEFGYYPGTFHDYLN
jgi:hypothetical protein